MRIYCHILFFVLASFCQGALDFNRDVRPILSDKCFACHGPDEEGRKADLRLDIESEAKNDELMAIVAGSPEDSEMVYRIHSEEEDELMPPPDRSMTAARGSCSTARAVAASTDDATTVRKPCEVSTRASNSLAPASSPAIRTMGGMRRSTPSHLSLLRLAIELPPSDQPT